MYFYFYLLIMIIVSLLQCNRDESNQVNQQEVEKDINDLYEAGEGKWGTDEEVFNRIFAFENLFT